MVGFHLFVRHWRLHSQTWCWNTRSQPQWETPRRSYWQLQQGLTNYGVKFQHFILTSWNLRLDKILLKLRVMLSKIKYFLSTLPGWALMHFVDFWDYHWCANVQISCTLRNLHVDGFWIFINTNSSTTIPQLWTFERHQRKSLWVYPHFGNLEKSIVSKT